MSNITNFSIMHYLKSVLSMPVLTFEEEQMLAYKWVNDGCKKSAEELTLRSMRFVAHIVKQCCFKDEWYQDLMSQGALGLMKAVKVFDPTRQIRLASFAVMYIKSEIYDYITANEKQYNIVTSKPLRKVYFNIRRYVGQKTLTDDDMKFIASELNVDVRDVKDMYGRMYSNEIRIDHSYDEDDNQTFDIPVDDNPLLALESRDEQKKVAMLYKAIDQLDERSKDILMQRWLVEESVTLQTLSNKYDISKERIRQLEQIAITKVQKLLS